MNRRAATIIVTCAPLLAVAGCPSQPSSSSPVAGETNPCAANPRPMAFTHATFRVPSRELRELDAQGCLSPGASPDGKSPFDRMRSVVTSAPVSDPVSTPDDPPIGTVPPPPPLDWNYATPSPVAPVTGTPALFIQSFPSSDNVNDKLFYGTNTTRGPNFFALNGLYSASPTQLWSATNYGMDGGSVVLDQAGARVYVVDSLGNLNCYAASNGGLCNNWTSQAYTTGNGAALSSPWFDYVTGAIYFGDLAGKLYKISGLTGALIWSVDLNTKLTAPCNGGACSPFGIRSSPIQISDTIFVGNDAGAFFRIIDPGATTPTTVDADWLCTSPTAPLGCGSSWSMLNGATLDNVTNTVYAAASGVMFEYPLPKASTWNELFKVNLAPTAGYPVYSSPIVEYNNTYVYVGYNNKLFKVKYPFNGTTTATSAAMAGAGPDGSYPHSSPLPYSSSIYIGDGSGSADRFGCLTSATAPALTAMTINYGTSVDSVPVIDFGTGNINFGYSNDTSGGVVQIAQTASWGCGTGSTCSTAGCGGTTSACINLGQCCTVTDCGTAVANSTISCTSNNCVTACNSGYKTCGTSCITNASCCSDADCSGGTPVCSAVGGSCVAGQNISFKFHTPPSSSTQSVVATINTPVTTLTATGVTFTNGSAVINGTGTAFTTNFKAGQQISADGTNFNTISVVNSATKITLTSSYMQSTKTVASYYEADCIAGQTCPKSTNYNVVCTSTPCTLTVKLPNGDYALTAKAYDGATGTGRVQGAFVTDSRFRITGSANDLTTVDYLLPRVYPVGTNSSDARCPLDLTFDSSGNVWTVNGNGNSGSNCSGPTNNISKLVKGTGAYAPTVVNNPAISASPEFIDADNSGNVWTTVPTLANGLFRLDSTGAVTTGFPVGSGQCQIPRGVAVDKAAAGGGAAYVACYGTNTFPGANGRRIQKYTSAGVLSKTADFTDLANQPVSIIVPYATGNTVDEDYNCRTNVYVNRSSPTSVVLSRFDLNLTPASLTSITQSSSTDDNPYGLAFDGAGTAYTVTRANGNIINAEYNGSAMSLDSNNASRAAPTPWGVAADDQYVITSGYCHNWAQSDMWVSHSASNQVSRFNNNPQTAKNNYLVGSTSNPQPRAIKFDSGTGYLWVANSAEATLSRISKRLGLFAGDTGNSATTACPTNVVAGSSITVSGKGFDATAANNTVLVGGYLATPTAVTINATGTLDTMTVKVASNVVGVVAPITLINADGAVQSLCTYTTK